MKWVIDYLKKKKAVYEYVEHKKPASKDELEVLRNLPITRIAKVLLLRADDQIVLCVLPIKESFDKTKLKKLLGAKSVELASKKEAEPIFKKAHGILPPMIPEVKKVVDVSFDTDKKISFSVALDDTHAIIMKGKDMIALLDASTVASITPSAAPAAEPEKQKEKVRQSKSPFAGKKFLSIQEAMDKGAGDVMIRGWVYRERGSSKLKFIVLRDATSIIQCVIEKGVVGDSKFETADKLQVEASMEIQGTIKKEERAPTGYELHVKDFHIVGDSNEFPIQKDQSVEFLADNRHLWLRSRKMAATLKIRSTVFGAIDAYFRSKGFFEYHSPMFTSMQCEGGSTLFEVNYFGKPVYLSQSWQLHAEPGIFALEKIYTIAPSFRAEKSKTSRHLTEYWHAEMEMAWSTFEDIQDHGEALLKFIVEQVLKHNKQDLEILQRDIKKLEPVIAKPFIRMTYDDALKVLKTKCKMDVEWGKDLRTIEEEKLTKLYDVPLIVTNYPKKVKAFYMKEVPGRPDCVQGCDFLAPEGYGEIIGGSQREEDIEEIKKRLKDEGEDLTKYEFYLDTRRYGSVPHGGFGMGVERVIAWICGLESIKDAIAFPRTMLRYTP